jgi:hypothetical protein
MKDRERMKEIADGLLKSARGFLENTGDCLPIVVLVDDDGKIFAIIGALYGDRREKYAVFAKIRLAIMASGAGGAVHISDCWYSGPLLKGVYESPNFVPLSDRTDRMEALSAVVADAEGAEGFLIPYVRGSGDDIVFDEEIGWKEVESNLIPSEIFR